MNRHIAAPGFKRQVVFRISAEDWPLLEAAAARHGSIQAAVLAGLQALHDSDKQPAAPGAADPEAKTKDASEPIAAAAASGSSPVGERSEEEISAREAARLLGLKPNTVRGYIRSGRLAGRYDGEPHWRGWLTTRAAVAAYRRG